MMFRRASDRRNHPVIQGAQLFAAAFFCMAALSTAGSRALAQGVVASPQLAPPSAKTLSDARAPAARSNTLKISSKPEWQELTPAQQLSLKPLAANWKTLGEAQKRKWIAIAANYPNLTPTEQAKLHSRMTEWVSLSQQQRDQARLNFAQSKKLAPTQKTATWQAYQALSPEEKKKLAISATPKPVGAAAAAKPVPPQKLAAIPVTRQTPKQTLKINGANHAVNRNTLLPQSPPPGAPASAQKN